MDKIINRVKNKIRRFLRNKFGARPFYINLYKPIISFTFDDFPRSAGINGSNILEAYGYHGTYYVSMKNLSMDSPSGKIANIADIERLLCKGHEIGCHTYSHLDGWSTNHSVYLDAIDHNLEAFQKYFPTVEFESFAYPMNGPTLSLKKKVGPLFRCCRGGNNIANNNWIDLNLLNSCFIDWRNNYSFHKIKQMIDLNAIKKGWLIFSTHDVSHNPSKYGCSISLFENIVKYSMNTKASILSVREVCNKLDIVRSYKY